MHKKIKGGEVVELLGDEMARIIWEKVRDLLILPFVDISLQTYDLSIQNREHTQNEITQQAARAIQKCGVGLKCATITPDKHRQKEFRLTKLWRSPNAIIRAFLGGTIFREPIICKNIPQCVPHWKKPIIIGRHAFGDQYNATEFVIPGPGKLTMTWEGENETSMTHKVHDFCESGVALGMFNLDSSIKNFSKACMQYALNRDYPLFLSTKRTILPNYDGRFCEIFRQTYEENFRSSFEQKNLFYDDRLIDDMVALAMKMPGGFIWACKNYDGDVQSDFLAQGYGSLGMMTSVLISPDGRTLTAEAAHGTITRHFTMHTQGLPTSTNPVATLFTWTKGLKHRAYLDHAKGLVHFVEKLEQACIQTIEEGFVTKDLATLISHNHKYLNTDDFLKKIVQKM